MQFSLWLDCECLAHETPYDIIAAFPSSADALYNPIYGDKLLCTVPRLSCCLIFASMLLSITSKRR